VKPHIVLHDIASIRLTQVEEFEGERNKRKFYSRDLVITGSDGDRFIIPLFADEPHKLEPDS